MKTADFLPSKSFQTHLERRRTPKRVLLLLGFGVLCAGGGYATQWEADRQTRHADVAERPDEAAMEANRILQGIYEEMGSYAAKLDPLVEHLQLPRVGPVLAGLSEAAGRSVLLEQVNWHHEITVEKKRSTKVVGYLVMSIAASVRGDEPLLELPSALQEFTGYRSARTISTKVDEDRFDSVYAVVELQDDLYLPSYLLDSRQ